MKKVYLAGKMSGLPDLNFPAFFEAEKKLQDLGYEVFNLARNEPGLSYRECITVNCNYILNHADALALIPGWEDGPGVMAEKALAECLKLEIIYL